MHGADSVRFSSPLLDSTAMPLSAGRRRPSRQGARGKVSCRPMNDSTARTTRLSRKEWTLVALGVGVWVALAAGGVWFVHQVTRQREACGNTTEAPTRQAKGAAATAPATAFTILTGTGHCQ
jgi:hypothetical protein